MQHRPIAAILSIAFFAACSVEPTSSSASASSAASDASVPTAASDNLVASTHGAPVATSSEHTAANAVRMRESAPETETTATLALISDGNTAAPVRPAAFNTCATCHTITQGGDDSLGPNLFGIVGARAGRSSTYSYSTALRNSRIVWTREELDAWLTNPSRRVQGTRMYQAVPSAEDRNAIIDYLAQLR